jgi:hypothetical protein
LQLQFGVGIPVFGGTRWHAPITRYLEIDPPLEEAFFNDHAEEVRRFNAHADEKRFNDHAEEVRFNDDHAEENGVQ